MLCCFLFPNFVVGARLASEFTDRWSKFPCYYMSCRMTTKLLLFGRAIQGKLVILGDPLAHTQPILILLVFCATLDLGAFGGVPTILWAME